MTWKRYLLILSVSLCALSGLARTVHAQAAQNSVIWTDGDDGLPFFPTTPQGGGDSIPLDDGSIYWPMPGTRQSVMDELWENTRGTCEGDNCNTGMDVDDPDAQAIAHEGEAAASTSTAAPGTTINPTNATVPTNQPFVKEFHKDEDFGHRDFGASYTLDGAIRANPVYPVTGGTGVSILAGGNAVVYARVFNATVPIATATLAIASRPEAGASAFGIYFLGTQVYTLAVYPSRYTDDSKLFSRTFAEFEKSFFIYAYRVTIKVGVGGNAGATFQGKFNEAGAQVTLTPQAGLFVNASATVDLTGILKIVRVGVEGSLTLIRVTAPMFLKLGAASCNELEALTGSDLSINTLSGQIRAFVKVKLLFIKKKKYVTLAKFSGNTRGFTGTVTLLTAGIRQPFVLTCSQQLRDAITELAVAPASAPPSVPTPNPNPPPPAPGCRSCQLP